MVVIVVTLVLSVLLAALFFIPWSRTSGHSGKVRSNASDKDRIFRVSMICSAKETIGASRLLVYTNYSPCDCIPFEPTKSYSKAEVSLHNKRTDCWIIIKDRVYDVTPYVEEHPGGDAILAHAGDDSTEGFFGPQHATRVFDMIEDFYIGNLEL